MRRVALTGGIATGKSYVARRMRAAGVPVVDADVLAREAVAPGSAGLRAVRERFGPDVIDGQGALDRARLAGVVFSDARARRDLEAIVHPFVRAGIETFFAALPAGTPFAVADVPLLYETGLDAAFAAVIVAACPRDLQVRRVMDRDGATREQAERRLDAQWPIDEKVARADYVIRTDGAYEATDAAVDTVIEKLRTRTTDDTKGIG